MPAKDNQKKPSFYLVNPTDFPIAEDFVASLLMGVFERLPAKEQGQWGEQQVGVVFCEESEMRNLNEQYRGKDRPTDVLSFNMNDPNGHLLGEVILCSEVVRRQAKEHDLELNGEAAYLILHGILHLLGHDHEEPEDSKIMMDIQDKIFEDLQQLPLLQRENQ